MMYLLAARAFRTLRLHSNGLRDVKHFVVRRDEKVAAKALVQWCDNVEERKRYRSRMWSSRMWAARRRSRSV
jgi:hypothetical protein